MIHFDASAIFVWKVVNADLLSRSFTGINELMSVSLLKCTKFLDFIWSFSINAYLPRIVTHPQQTPMPGLPRHNFARVSFLPVAGFPLRLGRFMGFERTGYWRLIMSQSDLNNLSFADRWDVTYVLSLTCARYLANEMNDLRK